MVPDEIDATGAELIWKKLLGKNSVICDPVGIADAVVNANVADLPAAFATRSAAAIVNDTPLTCPPSAPEAAPNELPESCDVATLPEVSLAAGGPVVSPVKVTVTGPAGSTEDAVVTMMHDENKWAPIIKEEELNTVELTDPREISALGAELLEKKPLG